MNTQQFPSAGITLGSDEPVLPWDSYLTVAGMLWAGVEALDPANYETHAAHAFVSGHVLECLLKTVVSRSDGNTVRVNDSVIRHNLVALWSLAHACELPGDAEPPLWVQQLHFLHDRPFRIRYAKDIVGIAMPHPEPARSEIRAPLRLVETV